MSEQTTASPLARARRRFHEPAPMYDARQVAQEFEAAVRDAVPATSLTGLRLLELGWSITPRTVVVTGPPRVLTSDGLGTYIERATVGDSTLDSLAVWMELHDIPQEDTPS